MKVVQDKKIIKVLFSPKSNPGIHNAVIIIAATIDSAVEIFKTSGIQYVGAPAYIPIAESFITDEIDVVMEDTTEPEKETKPKKGKEGK